MINHIPDYCRQIPAQFVELCEGWHSGQDSMLYAIASTGNLTTGSNRPNILNDDTGEYEPATEEDWYLSLWDDLRIELVAILKSGMGDLDLVNEFYRFVCSIIEQLEVAYG